MRNECQHPLLHYIGGGGRKLKWTRESGGGGVEWSGGREGRRAEQGNEPEKRKRKRKKKVDYSFHESVAKKGKRKGGKKGKEKV